ncbi:hypothetical protein TVAG_238280 [Trichomonas vaginalis G3]|uniref:Uncharacterized protein n=1 Tax=Trichomonas vaginalis (strain ATCC PRA-98 / G3) TaxID=412133 RepID=A2DD28_TRIV3|nr:MYB-binding protein 1A family member family [Trichomonas vaginalis G3]EAY21802.1 hypothetical protein TVAG_238280 [Trichomonas vaginalis G3]KAI5524242.1 MYB-binding protein 1A family member family [Trichomonas vaginalis G3]|eukprot:XP_001582788.1 hypothetical protein [Trichomonas vaginalis G3]
MTSKASIQAFAQEADIEESVRQLLKITKESAENLNTTIDTLVQLISDDKNQKNKPRYCYMLTSLLKKNKSEISGKDLLVNLRKAVPEEGRKDQKRRHRTAYILSLACVSRAGLLKQNYQLAADYIQTLYDITTEHPVHTGMAFSIIADIASANIPDSDTFMELVHPVVNPSQKIIEKNVDALYMWTSFEKEFKSVANDELLNRPLSKEYLLNFAEVLLQTADYRPSIHPIWYLLAKIDHKQLLDHVSELWLPDYQKNKPLIAYAVTACVPLLDSDGLLDFLGNKSLFVTSLSFASKKLLIPVLMPKFEESFNKDKETLFKLLISLLSIDGDHSDITKICNDKCSSLSDEDTLALAEALKDAPSQSYRTLLWAQKTRANIKDYSVIPKVFALACQHAKTDDDRLKLSEFVGVNFMRCTSDGTTWFTLLTGIDFSLADSPTNVPQLADMTNRLIDGINKVNSMLNITPEVAKVESTIESVSKTCGELLRSDRDHMKEVGKLQLKRALPYLDPSTVPSIFCDAELLSMAVRIPELCGAVLPMFIEHIRQLSDSQRQEMLKEPLKKLPISSDDALKIAQNVVNRAKSLQNESAAKLQDRYVNALMSLLPDDQLQKLVSTQVSKVLTEGSDNGVDVITTLIGLNSQTAFDVLDSVTKVAPKVEQPKRLEIMRNWISECCKNGDISSDSIVDAIFAAINYEYNETPSSKKKLEAALKWADRLIKKLERDINRNKFREMMPMIAATGSREAGNLIRSITLSAE